MNFAQLMESGIELTNFPVYPFSRDIAHAYHQENLFDVCNSANKYCRDEIAEVVTCLCESSAPEREWLGATHQLYMKYGLERMRFMLTLTVRRMCKNGYSRCFIINDRKACNIDFPCAEITNENTVMQLHPKAFALFLRECRMVEEIIEKECEYHGTV